METGQKTDGKRTETGTEIEAGYRGGKPGRESGVGRRGGKEGQETGRETERKTGGNVT